MELWTRKAAQISADILQNIGVDAEFLSQVTDDAIRSQIPSEMAEHESKILVLCMATVGPYVQPVVLQTILAQAEMAGLLT